MANISDAFGDLSLEGDWNTTDITNLLYVLVTQDGHEYFIHLNIMDDYPKDWMNKAITELIHEHSLTWYGSGRWTMQNNLESLHNWSYGNFQYSNLTKVMRKQTYALRRTNLLKAMKKKKLFIHWEFTDYEPGCQCLYKQTGDHFVNDDGVLVYQDIETKDYDVNLKNYEMIMCDGDSGRLDDAVHNILDELGVDHKWHKAVCELIEGHPTWYDLPEWGSYKDELEAIPEQLGKDVMQLVNEGHV